MRQLQAVNINDLSLMDAIPLSLPFDSEAALINSVLNNIGLFFDDENFCFTTEVPVGSGTVDVMAGKLCHNFNHVRKEIAITNIEAFVFSKLHTKQRLTGQSIAHRAKMPPERITPILEILCDKGLCIRSGRCYLRRPPLLSGITTIEGKIKDWKRALQQATRNRLFSCQSFVALDAKYSRSALKNLELFKQYQVGLVIVFRDAPMQIVYRPPEVRPLAPVMPIMAEFEMLNRISQHNTLVGKNNDKCYHA